MYILNLSKLGCNGTGVLYYSLSLVRVINELGLLEGIICTKSNIKKFDKYNCKIYAVPNYISSNKKISKIRPILWFLYSYIYFFKFRNKTILTTTHHILPFVKKQIIHIHDLISLHHPDIFLQKLYFKCFLPLTIKKVHKVIATSQITKNKVSATYDIDVNHIKVINCTVDSKEFYPFSKINLSCQNKKSYLLCVGASLSHKNIHKVLLSGSIWAKTYRLKIICGYTDYFTQLKKIVSDLDLVDKVDFYHDISFNELKSLYRNATALVYPSSDEGFGIPPLESMASGTPVIVSSIPVFKEILEDAAIYVNPDNPNSWKNAFSKLEKEYDLIVEKGLKQSKKYSADRMKEHVKAALL